MIRDFVSADDSIDLSALSIADQKWSVQSDGNGRTYVVSDDHVLAELMFSSDTTVETDDVILSIL